MNNIDESYKHFTDAYRNKRFILAGKMIYEIVALLPEQEHSIHESWQLKFSGLLEFLHKNQFVFDTPDTFYDMLATIALKIKKNPNVDWRAILN